jgi:cell wall-associated NlpC family hydrolase
MKTLILTTTLLITSIPFFTGCTNSSPQATNKLKKESLSVYNIMGIVEPTRESRPLFVVKDSSYNFRATKQTEQSSVSNNIEVISYGSSRPRNTDNLINTLEWNAKSFLGTPYVWAATGPSKFDCSGFTQWVYRDVGINIPRVSRDQAKVGRYVMYKNLRKGDMVFFDTKKRRSGRVTHVGIYLGNGNFIHASSAAKKVVVYNFNEKNFYKERFLWGRRVIHSNMHYASNPQEIYY